MSQRALQLPPLWVVGVVVAVFVFGVFVFGVVRALVLALVG